MADVRSEQYRKFQEAAREHGADVPEEEFDRALRKVGKAPPARVHKPDDKAKRQKAPK